MIEGFFRREGHGYLPQQIAVSGWLSSHLGGPAVCGILAHEVQEFCPAGHLPARFNVELFRPVANRAVQVRTTTVREGRRITVVDAEIVQDGRQVVRASVSFLSKSEAPPGDLWNATRELHAPPTAPDSPHGSPPMFRSGDGEWTRSFAANQNAQRKAAWMVFPSLIVGEPITPFVRAAMIGDMTNHVCHWGSMGSGYINADMLLSLARLPVGHEVGIVADDVIAAAGVSVGTAVVYDRHGEVGRSVVTALSNSHQQIDYRTTEAEHLD